MTATATPGKQPLLAVGQMVAKRYVVEREIGEGAQGVVYLARDTHGGGRNGDAAETGPGSGGLDRVALKVLHRHLLGDKQIHKRFDREAAILKRLEGEHLVKLLDFVEEDGLLMIALEYVEGRSLEDLLREKSPLDLKKAIEITLQVAAALGCAHAGGVVHRDLKPANVLIEGSSKEADSTRLRVRVVDFGLAKVVHGEHMTTGLTEHDMIFGTPEYMAPEQVKGEDADLRADLYAAGVMLYEMSVGKVPFTGRTPLAAMTAHLTEEVPPPRSSRRDHAISLSLEAVILRALAKEPKDRYSSARELAEALVSARDEPKVVAPVSSDRANAVVIATSDTDLNLLGAAALASMKTLPLDGSVRAPAGMDATLRSRIDAARADAEQAASSRPKSEQPPPTKPPSTSPPTTKQSAKMQVRVDSKDDPGMDFADTAGDGADLALPVENSRRWVWIAVAVVFALVGVAIGAVIGAR